MIKKILRALGFIVLFLGLAIGALIGFAFYFNHAAEKSARDFCAGIAIGSDINDAVSRAEREGIRRRVLDDKAAYDFVFQGWVFNAGVCHAAVANGKVVSVNSQMEGD